MWNVLRKNISQRNNCLRVLSNKVTPKFAPQKFDEKISDRWYLYFHHVRSSRSHEVILTFLETKYRVCAYSIHDAFAWQRPTDLRFPTTDLVSYVLCNQIICKPNTSESTFFCIV